MAQRWRPAAELETEARGSQRYLIYINDGCRALGKSANRRNAVMQIVRRALLFLVPFVVSPVLAGAEEQNFPPLDVPARSVPVPDTVSPQMRRLIGAPLPAYWKTGVSRDWGDWGKTIGSVRPVGSGIGWRNSDAVGAAVGRDRR